MNQTLEQRMESIEDQLKEIRKELEESLALYTTWRPVSVLPKLPREPKVRRIVNEVVINKDEL